ncbi:hypothetical protein FIV42_01745 [Persicimonas caeni]|uniref:Squalene/phytoene synthase family protein n=2 Tax=Persicimonas caeni TaxID=2292766 RepID=A0A4Y6PMR0_PERCE|nr:hypothetical protein FIV42_01745 [Persicimonas caeni]QED30724.1 hypothetical protein FRD00_01740 [Persicimonas caeni]
MMSTAPSTNLQKSPPPPPALREEDEAWAFCWHSLVQVSRTFSKPIELLPAELRAATTCGYLLCRIADTVEDDPNMSQSARDELFTAFLAVLEDGESPARFCQLAHSLEADAPEFELATNLDRVLRVFEKLPEPMQRVCVQWTGEMVRGMSLYGHRQPGANGVVTLNTVADLERYCYFVAGTVGRLLTGLFSHAIDDLSHERFTRMHQYAESFGLGLQMVNILKDQTDDLTRGWCFIPQTLWRAHGLTPADMLDETRHDDARAAVAPVFDTAREHLDAALEYTLAIPAEQTGIRLFCLLPLWMAVRTLAVADGNEAMFVADAPVKISRDEVGRLIASATQHVADDAALREQYAKLCRVD